jgi:hypothetical protein
MPILQDTKEHLQNSEKQCTSWVHCNLIPWLCSGPFLQAFLSTSSFHSGLTTCTVTRHTKCCSIATPAILCGVIDAQFRKPHCCCYIQNNQSHKHMAYETRPKIMHSKHKKEIQIMIPISTLVPTKMCCPCLAQPHSWHKWLFFLSWFGLLWSVFFPIFCVNEVHCMINSTLPQSKIVF